MTPSELVEWLVKDRGDAIASGFVPAYRWMPLRPLPTEQGRMVGIPWPQVQELITLTNELGVKFVACTTTMGMMGISRDAFIPEVETFAGVATYIADAQQSKINLFV